MIKFRKNELQKPKPLEGVKVLEYGVFHAGPGAGAILGDLGAEVIKIESAEGDPVRYWTQVGDIDITSANGNGLFFDISNRNKRCICLDIKTGKGRGIFNQLLAQTDVFLTNLRQSTISKLAMDYASISKIHPKVIYASVSGYGKKGSLSDVGAFDPMGQACSGMTFVTGTDRPVPIQVGILDQGTAITLSHAIITALYVRERQGIGQEVHVSLYSTSLWLQYANLLLTNVLSVNPCLASNRSGHSPLRCAFQCRDDKWIMGTHHPEERYWPIFCKATGQEALLRDPDYTDEKGGPKNYEQLLKIFDPIFKTKTQTEWIDLLQEMKLMFIPVQRINEIQNDPQALVNDYVVPCNYPGLGQINIPGYPIQFSHCDAGTTRPAPKIGEHTDEILGELGLSTTEIAALKEAKTVQ